MSRKDRKENKTVAEGSCSDEAARIPQPAPAVSVYAHMPYEVLLKGNTRSVLKMLLFKQAEDLSRGAKGGVSPFV